MTFVPACCAGRTVLVTATCGGSCAAGLALGRHVWALERALVKWRCQLLVQQVRLILSLWVWVGQLAAAWRWCCGSGRHCAVAEVAVQVGSQDPGGRGNVCRRRGGNHVCVLRLREWRMLESGCAPGGLVLVPCTTSSICSQPHAGMAWCYGDARCGVGPNTSVGLARAQVGPPRSTTFLWHPKA
jgi:hypothetical protein